MSERVLWEQRDGESSLKLCSSDDDSEYYFVSFDGYDGVKFDVSPAALLDLAFTIYEELG